MMGNPVSVNPLAINGLHRSGTTMTEGLFDSQPGVVCFSLFFQAVRAIAVARGFSDKGEILTEDFEQGPNVIDDANDYAVPMSMSMDHAQRIYAPIVESDSRRNVENMLCGIDRPKLHSFSGMSATHEDISDIGSLLQWIGERLGVRVCATPGNCSASPPRQS